MGTVVFEVEVNDVDLSDSGTKMEAIKAKVGTLTGAELMSMEYRADKDDLTAP